MTPVRVAILTALAGLVAVAAVGSAAAAAGTSSATCQLPVTSKNWRAVFGHVSSPAAGTALIAKLSHNGYKFLKLENRGCGDYAVVVESQEFSRYPVRSSFANDAAKGKIVVWFARPGNYPAKLGDVNVVFGHSKTLAAANTLETQVASAGWRETDVVYGGPRDWKVVWPDVPSATAERVVSDAKKAGYTVELELVPAR